MGVAVVLLGQGLALMGSVLDLYGNRGLVQWSVGEAMITPGVPRLSWLADALAPRGVSEAFCVQAVFVLYMAGLASLLVGWQTRWAAVVAWLTHLLLSVSGNASTYGVDEFANIALFYCVWMPVGHALSLDVQARRVSGEPTPMARLALRVLQLHLCMVYLASGIEKGSGTLWWDGEAIWRSVTEPEFQQFNLSWLAGVPWMAKLVCWGTLLVEAGYAFLVWPRWTRKLWVVNTIGMHLGIAVVMGLVSFAALMIVLNFVAFLVSPEPQAAESGETKAWRRSSAANFRDYPRLRQFTASAVLP
jgi:hypothetical protein